MLVVHTAGEEDGGYAIREVFYAEDGAILGCTANAVEPIGTTLDELARDIDDFKAALSLPVLTVADMPEPAAAPQPRPHGKTISHEELRAQLGLEPQPERSRRTATTGKKVAS